MVLIAVAVALFSAATSALPQGLESATVGERGDPGYVVHPQAIKKYCTDNNISENMPYYALLCWDKRDEAVSASASVMERDASNDAPGPQMVIQPLGHVPFRTNDLEHRRATPLLMPFSVRPEPRPLGSATAVLSVLATQTTGPDSSLTVKLPLLDDNKDD